MTRQFKYPEDHAEAAPVPARRLSIDEVIATPPELRGIPLYISPSERYAPEVVAFLIYGRGRQL